MLTPSSRRRCAALARHLTTQPTEAAERPKASHPKVHVLLVQLGFNSKEDREKFGENFRAGAANVYAREPNCLSYEMCTANEDEKSAIIYERYVTKADLDGPHQETLKANRAADKAAGVTGVKPASASLTHFTETNAGHMDRGAAGPR